MKSFRFSPTLLLFLIPVLFFSCSKERRYSVPDEVEVYVQRFIDEAEAHGCEIKIKRLIVEYVDNLENDGNPIAGRCVKPGARKPKIELDSDFVNMSPELQEQLIFHELGHCILELEHDDVNLSSGHFRSIMNSFFWNYIEGQEYKRAHYLNQLFKGNASEPLWVVSPATNYNSITPGQKTPVFEEEFDDNSNSWTLVNSNGHSMSINNSNMTMSSNGSEGLAALRNINLPSGSNYEIEARYKIDHDADQTNAIIMTVDGTFSVFGASETLNVTMGDLTTPQDIVTSIPSGTSANGYNVMTIRKVDDSIYYFINEKLVDYRTKGAHTITNMGMLVGSSASIDVDYFRVYTITP